MPLNIIFSYIYCFFLLGLRWQIRRYTIWQMDLGTCENLMWVTVFSSLIAQLNTWRKSARHFALLGWPVAETSPSKTHTSLLQRLVLNEILWWLECLFNQGCCLEASATRGVLGARQWLAAVLMWKPECTMMHQDPCRKMTPGGAALTEEENSKCRGDRGRF